MNLLSLVGPRLDNIYQIRRKWYYLSSSKNLQTKQAPISNYVPKISKKTTVESQFHLQEQPLRQRMLAQLISSSGGTPQFLSSNPL
jgi:hypothetical protein